MPHNPASGNDAPDTLASLAHDLRGSLHALRMGRELLKQLYPEEQLLEVCRAMESEEQRVSEIVEKLLALARDKR